MARATPGNLANPAASIASDPVLRCAWIRLDEVASAAIVEEQQPLPESPQRRGAELLWSGRSRPDSVGRTHPHVVQRESEWGL